jgi:hypothetical protein
MAGHDRSDRFEYLFDPIAGDTTATTTEAPVVSEPQSPSRRWSLLLLAAAMVAGAGVGCMLLWPGPVDAVKAPPDSPAPRPSPSPVMTRAVEPPTVPTPGPSSPKLTSVAPAPRQAPAPQPRPPTASLPSRRPPPPQPTVRAPISVSPAPRPAFPNQNPKTGGGGPRGGLLGGGGLL